MSPELAEKLSESYPALFSLISFRIETGDGWFNLIRELCEKIDALAKSAGLSGDYYPKAVQVKEKFGGLRFYIVSGTEEIFAAIDTAEEMSTKICETCGKPGRRVGDRWIVTACDICNKHKSK